MAKTKKSKYDPRQAGLFDAMFFDDEAEQLTPQESAASPLDADPMPDIEVVLPPQKQPKAEPVPTPQPEPEVRLRFMSFGSGSSGNCSYLGNDDGGILIDAGVDSDFVFKSLKTNGISPEMVKGIILTHDHGDHVRYAYTIVRRYRHIRIYSTPRLMNGLLRRHNVSRRIKDYQENIYKEITFKIADFSITAFDTSHDGTDNMGFLIENGKYKFVVATDMGSITHRADFYMKQANFLMLESNYDNRMLTEGKYPEYLKQRIRKDNGHLDNRVAAEFVSTNYAEHLKYLFLCHLSNDNNTPEIALNTMRTALEEKGISVGDCSNSVEMRTRALQLFALPRFECSPLFFLT